MSQDSERRRRTATTQAGIAIAVLLVALGVAGYFALRDTGRAAGSLMEQAREMMARKDAAPVEAEPPAPAASEAARVADTTPREPTSVQDAVAECMPIMVGMAEGTRVLAVDATATTVDFIQESETPGQFVRISCEWNGSAFTLFDAGRMVVPPMVGGPASLPAEVVDTARLTADFYTAQIQAAVAAAREPGMLEVLRVELSHVAGRGVLTRVRFQRSAGYLDIILDASGDTLPETTKFPQVQRMAGVTAEEAELGFRDLGQTIWTTGVGESVDRLRDRYFNSGEQLHELHLLERQVLAYLSDGKGSVRVVQIDTYGDLSEQETQDVQPTHCRRPFSAREARVALDAALRERGETLEEFEAHAFDTAIIDCAESPRRPAWRFGGG